MIPPVVETIRIARRVQAKTYSVAIARSFYSFGKRSVIACPARIDGERGISIGSGVSIGRDSWLQAHGSGPLLIVGDGVSVGARSVLSAQVEVRIDDHVLMGMNVYIADHQHNYLDPSTPVRYQGDNARAVRIGRGAWLGQNVVVCPGVHVGEGAVVAANSVVKESVPSFSLAAGAPASVVRRWGPSA